jgi:hypothetical protein
LSNIHFSVLASPDTHKEIVTKINTWKYDLEGKEFKGKKSPYILELRTYEVRLPDELEGKFCRDIGMTDLLDTLGGDTRNWKYKVLNNIAKFLRMFTPYKKIEKAEGSQQFSIQPFHYTLGIGKLKRKKIKNQLGTERVVL